MWKYLVTRARASKRRTRREMLIGFVAMVLMLHPVCQARS